MKHHAWHNIHPDFKLNGASFTLEDLNEMGYSLVKEGEEFEAPLGEFLLDWISNKPFLEVFTSGSTGPPKKITLHKAQMINSALATGEYFQLRPKQTALLCLPCSGIAGKMMVVRAMVLGLHLDYVKPSSTPLDPTKKLYDFVAMVPMQVQNSLEKLSSLVKTLIIGGAPLDALLKVQLKSVSTHVFETYGMTETITHIAVKEIAPKSSLFFKTLPHVEIEVDDRGCLVIDAPKISDGKIITNDLVELTGKNQFRWLGRYDSSINSGGIKLIPEKVEEQLSSIMESRFFVAGIPDGILGQKLILMVEGEPTSETILLEKIKRLKTISKYEVPKAIYFVKHFDETPSKKIDRKKTMQQIS